MLNLGHGGITIRKVDSKKWCRISSINRMGSFFDFIFVFVVLFSEELSDSSSGVV